MELINIIGANGHGKVVIDAIRSSMPGVKIIVQDDDIEINHCMDLPVIHDLSALDPGGFLLFAVGNNSIRKNLAKKYADHFKFPRAIIHRSAVVSRLSSIGPGSVVFANAVINPEAWIGNHVIVNTGAVIEHECQVEDYVHISPRVALGGDVRIGEGTHIGIGASVIQGVKIGKWSTIGAGAVVIDDIPDNCTAVGVPARPIKFH